MSKNEIRFIKSKVSAENRKKFYQSREWSTIRYKTLAEYGNSCMACGARPPNIVIHVDHIKPISTHWELRAELNNLQVLCASCNIGKSNVDHTDWRSVTRQRKTRDYIPRVNQDRPTEEKKIDNSAFTRDFTGMLLNNTIINASTPYDVLRMLGVEIPLRTGWQNDLIGKRIKPSVALNIYKYLKERKKVKAKGFEKYKENALEKIESFTNDNLIMINNILKEKV